MDIMGQIHCINNGNEYKENTKYDMSFNIEIPAYQRLYSWDKKNIDDFKSVLDTLCIPDKERRPREHFLGQIILHSTGDKKYESVSFDKQQYCSLLNMVLYFPLIYVTLYGQKPNELIKVAYEYLEKETLDIEELREKLLNIAPENNFEKSLIKNTKLKEAASKELLFLIEESLDIANRYTNQLEHIFPKKAKKEDWLSFTENEEYEFGEFHKFIGNHILLPGKVNLKFSNKSFKEKKEEYRKNKDECQQFKEIHEIMEKDDFTPEDIHDRSKKYAEKLYTELKALNIVK